jgi:hypothetical protein
MGRLLLLTDSNFIDNYDKYCGPKVKNLDVVNCQNKSVLLAQLAGIREGIVVISCLDLIASEAAITSLGSQDRAVELAFNHILWKVIDILEESDGKLACGIMAPIFWRSHSKLTREGLHHAYTLAKENPVRHLFMTDYTNGLSIGSDRVHLVPLAARKYIELIYELFRKIEQETKLHIVDFESPDLTVMPDDMDTDHDAGIEVVPPNADISMNKTLSNVSPSMLRSSIQTSRQTPASLGNVLLTGGNAVLASNPHPAAPHPGVRFSVPPPPIPNPICASAPAPATWPTMLTPELSTSLARIEQRIGSLETKSLQDNIMMAALQEEQDTEANKTMLDRITILGIRIKNINKMRDAERNPLMRSKVEEFISQFKEKDQEYQIEFVRHLNRKSRFPDNTVLEVRFRDEAQARSIRTNYIKIRDNSDLDNFNVTPTVRLATRVRIEILQAVSKLVRQHDSSVSKVHCLQFVSKPVLKVFRKDVRGNEYPTVMSFIDCVIWTLENDLEKSLDLRKAYQKAGSAFKGRMSQHFVIMS